MASEQLTAVEVGGSVWRNIYTPRKWLPWLPETGALVIFRSRVHHFMWNNGPGARVWKLDRLGRDLRHLVNTVHNLTERGIGLKVLTGEGAAIDATTASGKLVFGIFAALAEFERALISERTIAGLAWPRHGPEVEREGAPTK